MSRLTVRSVIEVNGMKRIFTLGVCLLLCVGLLCACDRAGGGEVSVDVNAPVHVLDDFKNGNVSCLVTVTKARDKDDASKVEEPVAYLFDRQEAVDLYNLLNRSKWEPVTPENKPSDGYAQMLTLDFFTGSSLDNARAYYGSFSLSNFDFVISSASPNDLSLSSAIAPAGTYDGILAYMNEKGETVK